MALCFKCSPSAVNQTSMEPIFLPRNSWGVTSSECWQNNNFIDGMNETFVLSNLSCSSTTNNSKGDPCIFGLCSDLTRSQVPGLLSTHAAENPTSKRRSWQEALSSTEHLKPRVSRSDSVERIETSFGCLDPLRELEYYQSVTIPINSFIVPANPEQGNFQADPSVGFEKIGNFQFPIFDDVEKLQPSLQQALEDQQGFPVNFGALLPGTHIKAESHPFAYSWDDLLLAQQMIPIHDNIRTSSGNRILPVSTSADENMVAIAPSTWSLNFADVQCEGSGTITNASGLLLQSMDVATTAIPAGTQQLQGHQICSSVQETDHLDVQNWLHRSLGESRVEDVGFAGYSASGRKDIVMASGKERSFNSTVTFGEDSCRPMPVDNASHQAESRKRPLESASVQQSVIAASKRAHVDGNCQKVHSSKRSDSWASSTLAPKSGPSTAGSTKATSRHPLGPALNTTLKPRARQGSASDPQSIAARNRRERINTRLKILQELVPNGSKVDLVTMLEKAINYVKFLQLQLKVLTNDEYWAQGSRSDQPSMAAFNFGATGKEEEEEEEEEGERIDAGEED